MLLSAIHRLVVLFTVIAFVGGMTLQLMPPKDAFAASRAAVPDCTHMAAMHADMSGAPAMPCKGMDPECVKQMGCLGTASLPLLQPSPPVVFAYRKVIWWLPASVPSGRSIKPALSPPIGL
jgi:hypothetical protein